MLSRIKNSLSKVIGFLTAAILVITLVSFPGSKSSAENIPDSKLSEMAAQIGFLVNTFRLENGLPPVYVLPYLHDVARVRSRECIETFKDLEKASKHLRPDGSSFSTAVDRNMVAWNTIFENCAAAASTPEAAMEGWKQSKDGHREAMLHPNLTHMGIGVAYEQNSEYKYYWVLVLVSTKDHYANEYIPREHDIVPDGEGDITGDSAVDTFDYLSLSDYIYKRSQNIPVYFNEEQLKVADCFRDGLITESDAKVLVRYILGEYETLPYVF